MSQGYAFIADGTGKGIRSVENLRQGDNLDIHLGDGKVRAQVCEIVKNPITDKIASTQDEE